MTRSPVTLRAVVLGLALGVLCCWWILRPGTTAPTQREVASASGVSVEGERPSRPRAREATAVAVVDATPADSSKPPRRVVFHVVADEDEKPIAAACVSDKYADTPTSSTTDALGDAAFDAPYLLKDDDAYFRVEAPGRIHADVSVEFKGATEVRRTVSLRPGFAVDGVVLDADGRPVSGARCRVEGPGTCMGAGEELVSTRADAEGRFHADGLPLNLRLVFRFSDPRHLDRVVLRRAHDTSFLDVRLEAAGVIRGIVRGPDGRPLGDARVHAGAEDHLGVEAVSADDGRFELGGLAFGTQWSVTAEHTDFVDPGGTPMVALTKDAREVGHDIAMLAPKRIDVTLVGPDEVMRSGTIGADWPGGHRYLEPCEVPGRVTLGVGRSGRCSFVVDVPGLRVAHADVEIGDGETQTAEIRVERGEAIVGATEDDVGAPVAGAEITIRSDFSNRWLNLKSDTDGKFSVSGLDAATHDVSAKAAGHGAFKATNVAPTDEPLRVVLPRDGTAAGRLRLPDGARRPTSRRIAFEDENYQTVGDEEAWTSDEFVTELAPGTWAMTIAVADHVQIAREVVVLPGQRTDLGTFELVPETPLVGRVVDAQGRAVRGATVWVDGTGGKWGYRYTDADADGRFAVPGLEAGEYPLRVRHDDFVDFETKYALKTNAAPLVVTLLHGAVLHVRLTGPDAKTLRTYDVCVDHGADVAGIEVLSEESPGRFSDRIAAGAWRVRVARSDDETTMSIREIELREGEDKTIEIELPK